jgi:hypothetical protein
MLAAGLILGLITNLSWAGGLYVLRGTVYNRVDPVPGCTVYFVSGGFASDPAITDSTGYFELGIPLIPHYRDAFLEVQFGKRSVFRQPIPADILNQLQSGLREVELPRIYLSDADRSAPWHVAPQ